MKRTLFATNYCVFDLSTAKNTFIFIHLRKNHEIDQEKTNQQNDRQNNNNFMRFFCLGIEL